MSETENPTKPESAKPEEINWRRLEFARWLNRAEAAALIGYGETYLIKFIDPIVQPRAFPGCKKLTYDRQKLDQAMEKLFSL